MRGLLFAMMKQSKKVELFKNNQSTSNALHAKYSTSTGDTVVADHEWGHLQLDATSIFILALAEMTAAGLRIIYTADEVDFVQNLVFYIERSYRTPDYGIWERGNKINHGQPELNSSSIGMAVGALQAINGINLYGPRGSPSSIIHVLPDELTRNYTTLHSALPRESNSKEIDSALLSVIGYPAFAVHDVDLIKRTRDQIVHKLGGKYGFKRFLRDGHQTVLENTTRLHYEPSELKIFEGIESQWPLFFTYMILEGLFLGNVDQVESYRAKLKCCLVDSGTQPLKIHDGSEEQKESFARVSSSVSDGQPEILTPGLKVAENIPLLPVKNIPANIPLIPELYIVPKDKVEAEKKDPNSQQRSPNENIPLVWAQSLYILGELLYEGLLSPSEIDPLGRHLMPTYRASQRIDTVVQVVLIAEDASLQAKLSMYGLETQTPDQIAPITISHPSALRDAYSVLGANSKLNLSGRPRRPIGTLSTSKLYRVQGRLYAFTPHFMDMEEFYMTTDNDYLVSVFEHELLFLRNHWWSTGRPCLVILLTHSMMGGIKSFSSTEADLPIFGTQSQRFHQGPFALGRQKRSLLNFMMSLKSGSCNGVRVRLGRLQEMLGTSCVESLDFLTAKIEQGYLSTNNNEFITWQDVLGGVKQRKKWDSKLSLSSTKKEKDIDVSVSSNTGNASNRLQIKRQLNPKGRLSPLLSPSNASSDQFDGLVFVGPVPDAQSRSKKSKVYEKPPGIATKHKSDFKLRKHSSEDSKNRLTSPIAVVKSASTPVMETSESAGDEKGALSAIPESDTLSLILADPSQTEKAVQALEIANDLNDQIDILHYLHSCHGLNFSIDLGQSGVATVGELIEEIYLKATHYKVWSVVRQAAGILKKVVNSLTINLTDLLIRQKYVTIGVGKDETTVSSPLGPDSLADIIYSNSGEDSRVAPLIQEILLYLGSFIRSEPYLFEGILRVRTYYIIIAMREEVSRFKGYDEEKAMDYMMQLGPSETKALLGYVLSAHYRAKQIYNLTKDSENADISSPNVDFKIQEELDIKCQSAGYYDGNFCKIEINGQTIISEGSRGLNVMIVDPEGKMILESTGFDTHISNEESDDFAKLIENMDNRMVAIVVCKDDCVEQLTEAAKLAAESLGSKMIRDVQYRDSWCLIGMKGKKAFESMKRAHSGYTEKINYTHTLKPLKIEEEPSFGQDVFFNCISCAAVSPSKGNWIRRRKIDGALQRTPVGFYSKVHQILEKSAVGILVNGVLLPRDPTVSEKTPEEINFALQVEVLMNAIHDPAERQIAVECLMIIWEIEKRNPELKLGSVNEPVNLMKIINGAYELYWDDWVKNDAQKARESNSNSATDIDTNSGSISADSLGVTDSIATIDSSNLAFNYSSNEEFATRLFKDLPQDGPHGTMSYLAKSMLKLLPYEINFALPTENLDDSYQLKSKWVQDIQMSAESSTPSEEKPTDCRPM